MHDLAIVLVSHNEVLWLRACLTSVLASAGDCAVDVVVVCNGSDGSAELVEREFPAVRVLRCENRGFAHANNTGLRTCDARYALLLNVDTEVRSGAFADLVRALDTRPRAGAAGVRQVGPGGEVLPTMRNFPSVTRTLGEAVGAERWPIRRACLGERVLDLERYKTEQRCDWLSGSFLALRSKALHDIGLLDERFFLYREEPDLCLRLQRAGWEVRHLPVMTILHHAGRGGISARMAAQDAFARLQYARKHFPALRRAAYVSSLGFGYLIRACAPSRGEKAGRRSANWSALKVLLGFERPPFGEPPSRALARRDQHEAT